MERRLISLLTVASIISIVAFVSCKKDEAPIIKITANPAANVFVSEGGINDSISVEASVTNEKTLSYQWYSNTSESVKGSVAIEGSTSDTYIIPDTLTVGFYYYYCEISATGGAVSIVSKVATITVTDGSSTYPYIVDSNKTLKKVGTNIDGWAPDKQYRQIKNIVLDSTEWTPIGTDANRFTGSYDGGGYSISNINISSATTNFQGMFGYIGAGGALRNIALKDVSINATADFVGGVAGHNSGMIENCYVTGNVKGGEAVGGITGYNEGEIKNCYTNCDITGSGSYIGGIAGLNHIGRNIVVCYATGVIAGADWVGGIVGQNSGIIDRCVALNKEISATNATGKIGRVANNNESSKLTNNFARAEGMTLNVNGDEVDPEETTLTGKDGEDVDARHTHGANSLEWWSAGRDAKLWSFDNNRLPWLNTTITGDKFSESQNPTVRN